MPIITAGEVRELAEQARDADRELADREAELSQCRQELATARLRREYAVMDATEAAYASGAIDGKNAEQRKVQLEAYLREDKDVGLADAEIGSLELLLARLEHTVALTKVNARYRSRLFDIGLAALRSPEPAPPVYVFNSLPRPVAVCDECARERAKGTPTKGPTDADNPDWHDYQAVKAAHRARVGAKHDNGDPEELPF